MTNRVLLAAVGLVCATALLITFMVTRDDPKPTPRPVVTPYNPEPSG